MANLEKRSNDCPLPIVDLHTAKMHFDLSGRGDPNKTQYSDEILNKIYRENPNLGYVIGTMVEFLQQFEHIPGVEGAADFFKDGITLVYGTLRDQAIKDQTKQIEE